MYRSSVNIDFRICKKLNIRLARPSEKQACNSGADCQSQIMSSHDIGLCIREGMVAYRLKLDASVGSVQRCSHGVVHAEEMAAGQARKVQDF